MVSINSIYQRLSEDLRAHARSTATQDDPANLQEWSDDRMLSGVCRQLNIPYVCLRPEHVDLPVYRKRRVDCASQRFLPFFEHDIVLVVVTPEPWSEAVLRELRRALHMEIHVVGCTEQDFDRAFSIVNEWALEADRADAVAAAGAAATREEVRVLNGWDVKQGDLMGAVKTVIRRAHAMGASDIIIDPMENRLSVRFRIMGSIEVMPPVGLDLRNALINQMKIFAGIPNEDQRAFRSGRAQMELGPNYTLSLRVESQPTEYGDAIVMRLLDPMNVRKNSGTLPFRGDDLERVRQILDRNDGIILVTGPTGSGKTTTLYRCLTSLDLSTLNVRTIEDPIEYLVDRIVQTQVGNGANFSQALRSMLRADPDVILVGEIRDQETADVAIQASLTGHLIISTLHTNDAIGAIPRLEDLNVSPFLIGQTLSLVVAQRLVPKLCAKCRIPGGPSDRIRKHFALHGLIAPEKIFTKCGCKECGGTGVVGRLPIFEFLYIDDAMRDAMRSKATLHSIRELWQKNGGTPLVRSGLALVAAGETTYNEVAGFETSFF